MAGIKSLRRIQLGQENTAGTAVNATTRWRGMGTPQDDREVNFREEDVGYLGGIDDTYISMYSGSISFEETGATFEQVPYILSAGIKNVVSGTADTGGSGHIYTYTFPTTAPNTIQTYTIEGGDNQQEEEFYYAFVESFNLSGESGAAVMMSADWVGRQVQPGTFTGAVAVPTVEEILFQKGKVYIDAAGGTIGSTQVSNTLLAFDLSVTTGVIRKWTADGSLDFSFEQYTDYEVELGVTFEHNSSAVTEKGNWRNEVARLIRIDFEGSNLTTAGSSHSVKLLRLDLPGKWSTFDAIEDQDGNDIVTGTFVSRYNATAAIGPSIKVVNELETLT